MRSVIDLFWLIPPGMLVLVLGVEALIITVIPTKVMEDRGVKLLAVVICFALAFGEGAIIRHEHRETAEQHKRDMEEIFARFVKLDQDVLALQHNNRVQAESKPNSSDTLRTRTLDLSNEILQFLVSREVPPGFGQGGFGEGPFGGKPSDTTAYDKQTVESYFDVFEPRVKQIREELKHRGLSDSELDREFNDTTNTYSIRAIAERLTALAERLPN
jgi:hypothetical protein